MGYGNARRTISRCAADNGTVYAWGFNSQAELGIGSTAAPTLPNGEHGHVAPQLVQGLRDVVQIGAINHSAFALLRDGTTRALQSRSSLYKDGTLIGWGNSDWGQIGNGIAGFFVWTPVIPKLSAVTAVWATGNNSFAVTRDGGFWIWGIELGGTGIPGASQKLPVRFPLPWKKPTMCRWMPKQEPGMACACPSTVQPCAGGVE